VQGVHASSRSASDFIAKSPGQRSAFEGIAILCKERPKLCNFPELLQIGIWSTLNLSTAAELSAKSKIDGAPFCGSDRAAEQNKYRRTPV
jgi:hypothetical protein